MRAVFLILLLANLALAAWGFLSRKPHPNPLARQEIHADRLKLVPEESLSAPASSAQSAPLAASTPLPASTPLAASAPLAASEPAQAAPVATKVAYCYTWGPFSRDEAEKAKTGLTQFHPKNLVEQNLPGRLNYWTYIPPKKTRQEALDAVRALKEAGITDLFLIQEPGKWQYAISLGMFGTESSAKKHALQIRQKGVSSVTSGRRNSGEITFSFVSERKLPEKLESFPRAKLNRSECTR